MYLLLSTMTALLECGSVFLGICQGLSPRQILALCLAYQFGNLFPVPFRLSKKVLCGMICVAYILWNTSDWHYGPVAIALLAAALQSVRATQKDNTPSHKKRLARVLGFLLSPIWGSVHTVIPTILFGSYCVILFICLQRNDTLPYPAPDLSNYPQSLRRGKAYQIMLWHQLHYFIYAYSIILISYQRTHSSVLTVLLFAGTWMTYLITEPFLCHITRTKGQLPNQITIICGHIFLFCMLVCLPVAPSTLTFSISWILTGFGGGTVFAISALCQKSKLYQKSYLELTENIGHFAGTGIAVLWTYFLPLSDLPYLSAYCVLMVIILSLQRGDQNYENSKYSV